MYKQVAQVVIARKGLPNAPAQIIPKDPEKNVHVRQILLNNKHRSIGFIIVVVLFTLNYYSILVCFQS